MPCLGSYSRFKASSNRRCFCSHAATSERSMARPSAEPQRHPACTPLRAVLERVAERDEIEEMIGVHVADDDRIDLIVIRVPPNVRERARAEVEREPKVTVAQQIG